MESLKERWENFSISEAKGNKILIDKGKFLQEDRKGQLCMGASLTWRGPLENMLIQNTMGKIWKTYHSVTFHDIHPNLFLLSFMCLEDKGRVPSGRLWLFDSSLFSLQPFDSRKPLSRMVFNKECFWVQMHNLPFASMNEKFGNLIGKTLGIVKKCDVQANGTAWGIVLRVLIEIDIIIPLSRDRMIGLAIVKS